MKRINVILGATYQVKVSGKLTEVKLMSECSPKGWIGRNLATGREVRIKTAAKLRRLISPVFVEPLKDSLHREGI